MNDKKRILITDLLNSQINFDEFETEMSKIEPRVFSTVKNYKIDEEIKPTDLLNDCQGNKILYSETREFDLIVQICK